MNIKETLKEYFGKHWVSRTSTFTYSNHSIADKIAPHERVIDIGCGNNEFKPIIKNLTAIDLANPNADIVIDIEDYTTDELYDVALCLGSIQYGTREDLTRQITKVVSLLTPQCRIYWRTNTGVRDQPHSMTNIIPYYPWTEQEHHSFAHQFGFVVDFIIEDKYGRLYAEWSK